MYRTTLTTFLCLLLSNVDAFLQCASYAYSHPRIQDCAGIISLLPTPNSHCSVFIEQSLRASQARSDWPVVISPAPTCRIFQLPRIWSLGTCNIALLSLRGRDRVTSTSLSTWYNVVHAIKEVVTTCVGHTGVGGSTAVREVSDKKRPVLAIYVFDNISPFNAVLNRYQSADFPRAINALRPLADLGGNFGAISWDQSNESLNITDQIV